MLRLYSNKKLQLDEQEFEILNSILTTPKTTIEIPTKAYVDSLSQNNKNKSDMSRMIGELDIDFDNFRLTNLCGITLNRNPLLDEEVSNKKFIGDELDENTIL